MRDTTSPIDAPAISLAATALKHPDGPSLRRFGRLTLAILLLTSGIAFATSSPTQAAVVRPFATRFTQNTTGAITMTGNTLLTCPATATNCIAARSGTAPTLAANNDNAYSMVFVDVDGDPTTFNSSRNRLDLPAAGTVAWAGLYWGADTTAGSGGSAAANPSATGTVRFKTPGTSAYQTITASQVDTSPVTGGVRYQGFADVTSLVRTAGSGEYTTGNVQAGRGGDRYGGWALVVVYQDPNEPLRNLTVFDGYAVVQQTPASDSNVAIPVSGFLTPPSGQVRSRIGVVAYEGDLGLLGDSLRLNSTQLTNSLNPATNFFNSSLTGFNTTNTTGDPFQTNMLGFDIDTINANDILPNGSTSATINLNTNNDTYFPGVVTFSTELFAPELRLEKSAVDINGGTLDVGDEVLYTVRATNVGQDAAVKVVVSDVIPTGTTYVPGSLRIEGFPVTDAVGDDTGEWQSTPARVITRLGTAATASTGGTIAIGVSRVMSFRATVGTVSPGTAITNTAVGDYVGSTSGLPVRVVSNSTVQSPRQLSDLAITKSGPTAPVTVPGTFGYDLIVTNNGPATEPAAMASDALPAGFVASAAAPSQGSCALGATVVCDLGGLAVGATASIRIDGSVASGSGRINNTATVSGSNLDLSVGNNSATASVALNNPPAALDNSATTPSGTAVTVSVLVGATDPDGDPLTTSSVGVASNGTAVLNADGTATYTPNAGFKGDDTFTFVVSDGRGGTATATVTVTVANAAPVAVNDSVGTPPATPVIISVLLNDLDNNGDTLTISAITQSAGGTVTGLVTDNGDGTVTFAPGITFAGTAMFTYTITDGTATSTATVTVLVPDTAPVAVDDAATTPSATAVTVPVLDNDLDDNNDILAVDSITQPANGAAVDNGDGTITYTPNTGFKGDDTFTYTITDGNGGTATATVTITVENAPPVALDGTVPAPPGVSTVVDLIALISDPNSGASADILTIIGLSTPVNGAAVLNSDGTVTYTPNAGFKGDDTFTYAISDGTDTATATITMTVPNSPPVADGDARQTSADTPVTVPVLLNDFDPNGDTLTISAVTQPANGTTIDNADGTITYAPDAGFKGDDTFTYTVTDGTSTATATVTITVANAAPVALPDVATTSTNTPVSIVVTSNDTDPNGDTLTVVSVTQPSNGAVTIDGNGTTTYTPNTGFKGDDTFAYTITDGTSTATATATITVANAASVAVDDDIATLPATAVVIPVLTNDSDLNGDTLTVVSVTQPSGGATTGVATINGGGTVTFTPSPSFRGTATFTYTITDGTATATAKVTVLVPDAAPVAVDDSASTDSNTAVTVPVLSNDLDDNGDTLTIDSITQPANGAAVDNGDGTITYTPDPGFKGDDTFTYTITDGTNTATATVTVTVANAGPVAVDDPALADAGTAVDIVVLSNDSDPNGDALTVIAAAQPRNGAVVINAGGTITYTPDTGFKGDDTFTYTITDGTNTATATVTVAVANSAPVAVADSVATPPATPVVIAVLNNDVDLNNDTLTIDSITPPVGGAATGTVSINGDGTVTFTPNAAFAGTATFTYTITDGTAFATATVTVLVPNSAPVAVDDTATTPAATPTVIPVLDNDLDDNGGTLTIASITQPANGLAVDNVDGTITYTPNPGFKGDDIFTYTITDGTNTATATVTVTVANGAPVAVDDIGTTPAATPVNIDVLDNDADPNADTLTISAVTASANGTVVLEINGTITYTPEPGFKGDDRFAYTITDGTNTATASVTVTVGNAAPVAVDDAASTSADTAVTVPVLGNDVDDNSDTLTIDTITQPAGGTAVDNADGTITYTPNPGFTGDDTFTYTITDGTDTAIATVTVTVGAPAAPTTPTTPGTPTTPAGPAAPPTPSPDLPKTGGNPQPLVSTALLLLLLGATALTATRRRRLDRTN